MKKRLLLLALLSTLNGDEYDFDMGAIEQTPYEYSGYLRFDDRVQHLRSEEYQNYIHLEGLLNFSYNYDKLSFQSSFMAISDYIPNKISESDVRANDLYLEYDVNSNHSFLLGKESLKWGKGYYFNPVAFFDRPKDPNDPTRSREGFVVAKYSYNKSFSSKLQNISFDFVYLPSNADINKDYYMLITKKKKAHNIATRLYMLLYDTDIDIIYSYSDEVSQKIGIDFSKNIQTNFEIHGEYANILDGGENYLLGLRYLTEFELTVISEYIYRSEGLNADEIENSALNIPFIAKNYGVTLVTQKEPFELLYSSLYFKNMINLQDYSMQNKLGFTYAFKNSVNMDISYNINSGNKLSEFGKKSVEDFLWLRLTWNF